MEQQVFQVMFPERTIQAQQMLQMDPDTRSPQNQLPPRRPQSVGHIRIRNPKARLQMDVENALQELLAQLEEQNICVDIRKVKNKELTFEIRVPEEVIQTKQAIFGRRASS